MGLIREPLEVDFEFDPRPLTKDEKEQISTYIKAYKIKHSDEDIETTRTTKSVKPRRKVPA
jgi:hypothetical protein